MMIPSPAAGDPYARAAALERTLRSAAADGPDAPSDDGDAAPPPSPDVVVTLSHGASAPATYDASGRLPGRPTLDDMGANAPDSMARATESTGDDGGSESTDARVSADQDAPVPA